MRRIRVLRKLTPAHVVAAVALVMALGGTAVAAATITGLQIKNRTLTGVDVKVNSLTGVEVNEAKLATVPKATRATSATNATNATSATSAGSATTAATANAVAAGGVDAAALGRIPAFRGRPSFATFASAGSYRPIALDIEDFDSANMHAAGAAEIIIPRAGIWQLEGSMNVEPTSITTGGIELSVALTHADSTTDFAAAAFAPTLSATYGMSLPFSTPLSLRAGDTIVVRLKSSSTAFDVLSLSWVGLTYVGAA